MQQGDPNYGRYREHHLPAVGPRGEPEGETRWRSRMDPGKEQTWSMLAHLSVLAGFVGLVPFGPLIVWLVYRKRSPRVGFHALQSFWYQTAWIALFAYYLFVTVFLTLFTFGLAALVMVPLGFLLPLVPLVHQCYAACKVGRGDDFRYPLIADMIDGG